MKALLRNAIIAWALVLVVIVVGNAISSISLAGRNQPLPSPSTSSPAATTTATPTPSATTTAACTARFTQVDGNNASNRVDADMAQKVQDAKNNLAAGEPVSTALKKVVLNNSANNAARLARWSYALGLYDDPNDVNTLLDGDCLSAKGVTLYNKLKDALNDPNTLIEESAAPADGYNSGVENNQFGRDASSGVWGDTDAIHIVLADGTETWILIRCGNPVFPNKPDLPPVTTDNPPKPSSTPTPHPTPSTEAKIPSQDPNPQGNAGPGGGKNENPGTDASVAPSDAPAQPGTSRTNPPAPAADANASSSGSGSSSSSSGSSRSAPAPEQDAPAASAAASSCSAPPGSTC